MIGFGELRKLSLQWHNDITAVERAYAIDWLLKGLFDHAALAPAIILRGSSALRHAHLVDYPFTDDPEFLTAQTIDGAMLKDALNVGTTAPGVKYTLIDFARRSAKVGYIGPLGRRSATRSEPRITLSFIAGQPQRDSVRVPLIHRFSDPCAATVAAESLEENAAGYIAVLSASPRVRDVFDLWFIITQARERIDATPVRTLAREIAQAKHLTLPSVAAPFNPSHRGILERRWDDALGNAPHRPAFAHVEQELARALQWLGAEIAF